MKIMQSFALVITLAFVYYALHMPSVYAETKVVPSVITTGRYDTNIFNRPAQFLPSGTQTSDYVTSVGGAINLSHETRDIDASLTVGGNFNAYVENTGLNYFNAIMGGHIRLDRWIDQYIRGGRLRVTENFRYTPESPGFLTGVRQAIVEDDVFSRGIQGFRANTFINTTSVNASYPVSRDLYLEGGYTFALRRVGQIQGGEVGGVNYFDTNNHTWFGGPRYQLTRNDSLAAVYRQSFIVQSRSEGGRSFSTSLVTLAGDYTKEFQEWSFTIEGGVTFVEPAGRTFPAGSIKVRTQLEKDTVFNITLSRQARPSFFLQGGATISNLAQIGVSHRIYERLTIDGSAAYGYNQLFPNTDQTFKNLTASAGLSYKLTRTITAGFLYSFTNIDVDRTTLEYQFSRHVVSFMLTGEWR